MTLRRWCTTAVLLLPILFTGCTDSSSSHPTQATSPQPDLSSTSPAVTPSASPTTWVLDDPRITESSGIARSQLHPGVIYTHNDRGNEAELFAIDANGILAVLRLDVPGTDWEDIATTSDKQIWIGDIGDNELRRSSVSVAVVDEPDLLVSAAVPSTTYRFAYPNSQPRNAEALLVDPRDDRLYIVTKSQLVGQVFRAPEELDATGVNQLELVGKAPPNITAGDFSPDGETVVLRNQGRAFFYRRLGGKDVQVTLPKQRQGESVTFTADGRHVLVGSEGAQSELIRVKTPSIKG